MAQRNADKAQIPDTCRTERRILSAMAFGRKTHPSVDDPRLKEGAYVSRQHQGKTVLYRNAGQLAALDYKPTDHVGPVEELWKLEDAMSYGHDSHNQLLHEIVTVTRAELLAVKQDQTTGHGYPQWVPVYKLVREAPATTDAPSVDGSSLLEALDRELDQHLTHSAANGARRD